MADRGRKRSGRGGGSRGTGLRGGAHGGRAGRCGAEWARFGLRRGGGFGRDGWGEFAGSEAFEEGGEQEAGFADAAPGEEKLEGLQRVAEDAPGDGGAETRDEGAEARREIGGGGRDGGQGWGIGHA